MNLQEKKEQVSELRNVYLELKDLNKTRTANSIISKYGISFSAKKIQERYGCSFYTFLEDEDLFFKFFENYEITVVIRDLKKKLRESKDKNKNEEQPKQKEEKEEQMEVETETVETESVKVEKDNISAGINLNLPLGKIIEQAVKTEAPEIAKALSLEVKQSIKEAAKELNPTVINVNKVETGEVKGKKHSQFKEALGVLSVQKKIYMCGDTGTGKTKIAEQLAEGLGLRFESLNLSAGISEGHLTGRQDIQGNFLTSGFVDLYENGGLFLLDEVDSADANTLLVLNTALSNGKLPVPLRKDNRVAVMHEDFYVVCCGNTWGDGADERFSGREYLDEAFKDRFSSCKVLVEYDKKLEKELLSRNEELCNSLHKMRDNSKKHNLDRTISTRLMVDCMKYSLAGFSNEEILKKRIVCDYTDEEKSKILEGVKL